MNLKNIIDEFQRFAFQYHEMGYVEHDKIVLRAISLDPSGIDEAMKIKEIADRYRLHTLWDGENIEILKHPSALH